MHGGFKKLDPDHLLEMIKQEMRRGCSDENIRERMAAAGFARDIYMQRMIDGLIAQARNETRIPDPTDQAAVAAAQPIKFMSMSGWDDEPPPRREWAVLNRVPLRQVTLFSGEGGAGKSLLLLQLLCSTVLNRDWIGSLPEPGPAIYLGAEDEEDELHRRLDAIARHYDEPFSELVANGLYPASYAGEDMTLARFDRNGNIQPTLRYDRLHEQACDIHPTIVALDTLSDIFGGNENDRVQVSAFIGLLRKLAMTANCAVIINSHPSQAGSNSGTGLSGSTAWHGKVRGRMYLRAATQDEGGLTDPDLRVLEFKKNQYGPLSDSIPLRYKNGVFVPEPRGGTLDPQIAEQRAEQVFLMLLDRFTREGRNVTDKKGTSYAPAQFAKEQEAKAVNLNNKALEEAMRRLFTQGKIRVVTEGPASKLRSRMVKV
ncbi:AAA family ATPase [Bradyrhizobium sp. C-145]|uniref:AAA family ATPase n=1 Tax=Bradyrhizobium sp. C-145 TaxID=574727 RepID=UPI00201B528B|nr:AAA family ATPase [Bradyrhizobium sp. C-145]UQR61764.1 AAA family ATPase [Bradyrhizobium sp. C-145]